MTNDVGAEAQVAAASRAGWRRRRSTSTRTGRGTLLDKALDKQLLEFRIFHHAGGGARRARERAVAQLKLLGQLLRTQGGGVCRGRPAVAHLKNKHINTV